MHLTNYSINKENPGYNEGQDNCKEHVLQHKRSLEDFFRELKVKGIDTEKIWVEIKEIVFKTVGSI